MTMIQAVLFTVASLAFGIMINLCTMLIVTEMMKTKWFKKTTMDITENMFQEPSEQLDDCRDEE